MKPEQPKDYEEPETPPINWKHIIIASLIALLVPFCAMKVAKADNSAFTPPSGGDCYAISPFNTTQEMARINTEKGWGVLAYSDRLRMARLVSEKKAEVLLVKEHRVCGQPAGELKIYSTWYYREK